MDRLDNPAGRLHAILSDALGKPDTYKVVQVWAEVFGVDQNDSVSVLSLLTELMKLVDTTKDSIRACEGADHQLYLRPFANVQRVVFNVNLMQQWKSLQHLLNNETMLALQFCSELLAQHHEEDLIEEEQLARLQSEIESLIDQVLAANLRKELEAALVDSLDSVRRAILAYRISGARGLRRALQFSVGAAAFLYYQPEEEDKKAPILERFGTVIKILDGLVSTALKVKELVEPLIPLLGAAGDTAP